MAGVASAAGLAAVVVLLVLPLASFLAKCFTVLCLAAAGALGAAVVTAGVAAGVVAPVWANTGRVNADNSVATTMADDFMMFSFKGFAAK